MKLYKCKMDEYVAAILAKSIIFGELPRNSGVTIPIFFRDPPNDILKFSDAWLDKYFTPKNFYTTFEHIIVIGRMISARDKSRNVFMLKLYISRFARNRQLEYFVTKEYTKIVGGILKFGGKNKMIAMTKNFLTDNFTYSHGCSVTPECKNILYTFNATHNN